MNPMLFTDGYKVGHHLQYPKGTEMVYSNFTPRSSRTENKFVINFGLQYFIKEYLIERFNRDFFAQPKEEVVKEFYDEISSYLNDPDYSVAHVEALHDLGYLPIKIKALPEGAKVPLLVPLFTVRNTKKEFGWVGYWVTNFLETITSCIGWMPITSATTAFQLHTILDKYAMETVGNTDFVQWQAHDFSFRGMPGLEAALLSGSAHLTSFTGTDTIPAIPFVKKFYGATGLIGGSIPATEHSVMCAGGSDNELETFRRLLEDVYPKGPVSIVSDTWNYWGVLTNILPKLKNLILSRDGKLVVRPDSGDQFHVICGYKVRNLDGVAPTNVQLDELLEAGYEMVEYESEYYELKKNTRGFVEATKSTLSKAEIRGTVATLWDIFGGTVTERGYRLLDSHIGCILGDGVTPALMERILERLRLNCFASINQVFGIGSFTYCFVTRDTYGMAMKATFCIINGVEYEIFKDPKTKSAEFTKKSAKGLLQVKLDENGEYYLIDQVSWAEEEDSELKTVFEDSKMVKEWKFAEIRERIKAYLKK